MPIFRIPEAKVYSYQLDETGKYYNLTNAPEQPVKMPQRIKRERTIAPEKIDAPSVLMPWYGKWSQTPLTGLRSVEGHKGWHFGDHFHKGKKNYLLIEVAEDGKSIAVHRFNGFYPKAKTYMKPLNDQYIPTNKKGPGNPQAN